MSAILRGAREAARVAQHIRRAEGYAERRKVYAGPLRRLARKLLLTELSGYRARGLFPKNRDFAEPTPYFVDADGTRCAVAHLLEASGQGSLVHRIARDRNHARVAELADEPGLVAWLEAAGLSLKEAALIQPSYCFDQYGCVCEDEALGYFEVATVTVPSRGIALARVDAIHGSPSERSVRVGDEVWASVGEREVGTELLLFGYADRYEKERPVFKGLTFPLVCGGRSPALSKEEYLRAALAEDCEATLDSIGDFRSHCDEGCGCRAVRGGSPTSLGIVLALVGLSIGRRMQRVSAGVGKLRPRAPRAVR